MEGFEKQVLEDLESGSPNAEHTDMLLALTASVLDVVQRAPVRAKA